MSKAGLLRTTHLYRKWSLRENFMSMLICDYCVVLNTKFASKFKQSVMVRSRTNGSIITHTFLAHFVALLNHASRSCSLNHQFNWITNDNLIDFMLLDISIEMLSNNRIALLYWADISKFNQIVPSFNASCAALQYNTFERPLTYENDIRQLYKSILYLYKSRVNKYFRNIVPSISILWHRLL